MRRAGVRRRRRRGGGATGAEVLGDRALLRIGQLGALLAHDAGGERVHDRRWRALLEHRDARRARIAARVARGAVVVEERNAARRLRERKDEYE